MKFRLGLSALAIAALALTARPAGATTADPATCRTMAGLPSQVTLVIWVENKSVVAITPTAAPYLTSLQTACAWATTTTD